MFAKISIGSAVILLVALLIAAPHARADALRAATGYGQLLDPKTKLEEEVQLFAFTGIIEADGTEKGQAEFHNQVDDVWMHIEIDCVAVKGNEARLSGPVTHSNDPKLENSEVVIHVIDNGEGTSAKADLMSHIQFSTKLVPSGACKLRFDFADAPIQRGNIQIHPRDSTEGGCPEGTHDCHGACVPFEQLCTL